jgi:hypothetical protein
MRKRRETPAGERPCCVKCRGSMCRNHNRWFCRACPKTFVKIHHVVTSPYGRQNKRGLAWVRPCCIKCHRQMARNRDSYRCLDCPRWGAKMHSVSRLVASNPYCLRCRVQTCSASLANQKRFQCHVCKMSVSANSTYHGRVSTLPWCIYCRKMMHRARGTALAGGGHTGAFRCRNCQGYTLENAIAYRPRPSWRVPRLVRIIESRLPSGLDADVREEARSALLHDLITKRLKLVNLDAALRRYIRDAHVSRYGDVRLDAIMPSGLRRVDLMAG